MVKSRGLRADELFKKELFNIKLARANKGYGWESDRRITKAIARTSLWAGVKDIVINSPLDDDRIKPRRKVRVKPRK
jgi:hypothetical protein